VVSQLDIKKRRPINKKEAKRFNKLLQEAHNSDFLFSAGKYETAISKDFDVIISQGYIIGLILGDVAHLSVRGLLTHNPETGWIQVDMGAVPFVCNGANVMSAGINAVSPEIVKGQYVWIRDENHKKPLGVGKALLGADDILSSTKGKAIEALHYIGDKIWEYGVKD
jgi:PUA domain protein|tara:strand:+ start:10165 stop:10665 length:501 start_codon:yes stop_codon:yes gene_type:complete